MTQANAITPADFSPEIDAMGDIIMAEDRGQPRISATSENKCTADLNKNTTITRRQDVSQAEADRFAFEQRVQKLLIDLEDEIGVDILLMSGSHDDPECLAVKAIWVERRRMEELMIKTQDLHIRK